MYWRVLLLVLVSAFLVGCSGLSTSGQASFGSVADEGLAAHYSFDVADSLTVDSSGNGHDASCSGSNCPSFIADGKIAGAFHYDGMDDRWNVPGQLLEGSQWTIASWIRPESYGGNSMGLGIYHQGVSLGSNFLIYFAGVGYPEESIGGRTNQGSFITSEAGSVVLNEWQHVAMVNNGGTVTWYKDGTAVGVSTQGSPGNAVAATTSYIGSWYDLSSGRSFKGDIDELVVFNRILSADEIQGLFTAAPLTIGQRVDLLIQAIAPELV